MNFYKNNLIRFDQEEEPETPAAENPIEKMMGGMMFDKNLSNSARYFSGERFMIKVREKLPTGFCIWKQ